MKKISIIAAGLLLATGAMAQNSKPHGKHLIGKQEGSKLEQSRQRTKMMMSGGATANKSTATYQRMKAFSEWGQNTQGGPVVFFDSLTFAYTGMRGSEFNYNTMSVGYFDPIYSPMLPDNKLMFHPDEFDIYAPNLVAGYTITYDVDDKVTEMYLTDNSGGQDQRLLFYYTGNDLMRVEELTENGPNWDTTNKRYFEYDVNNMLVVDSVMENMGGNVWNIYQKCEYTRDMNGNITNLLISNTDNTNVVFQPYEEDVYTYNVDDQIVTAVYSFYDEVSSNMELVYKDSFEYTTGFDHYTKDHYYSWDDVNASWLEEGYMERMLNTDNKPEMTVGFSWDGTNYTQEYEERYSYNTEGNPIHDSVYLFTNQTIDEDPVYVINYYYEDYWDLGVDRTAATASINVYPNPVTDIMTISSTGNQPMSLQLVNAMGQTVKNARATGTAKLSIGDLSAGMYFLTVTDVKGNKLHTQSIVKQ